MDSNKLTEKIIAHYSKIWNNKPIIKFWNKGPLGNENKDFCILEFPPNDFRKMWTYATSGMSNFGEQNPIELHIFSKFKDDTIVELLTVVAFFHKTNINIELWNSIFFGRSWQGKSLCEYGLISLPYLDGPKLENLYIKDFDENLKFLWLIPITEDEFNYKNKYGIEALEELFEKKQFNYLDPNRKSVL